MGIFQLIDYVGVDVVQFIMKVMNPHLPDEDLHSDLLDRLMEMEVRGGQHSDGSQKDGILKYDRGRPIGIFDPDARAYVEISSFKNAADKWLGDLPASWKPWKEVNFSKGEKEGILQTYFNDLSGMTTAGAKLAKTYIRRSNEIGKFLVASKVANSKEDVNTVMLTGFYHAYGPINEYMQN
jgi:hypothetical protein